MPVKILSGYRCPVHNMNVGGASNSKHKLGIAADISVKGVKPESVYGFLDNMFPDKYGLGLYKGNKFVHLDIRATKARWKG